MHQTPGITTPDHLNKGVQSHKLKIIKIAENTQQLYIQKIIYK